MRVAVAGVVVLKGGNFTPKEMRTRPEAHPLLQLRGTGQEKLVTAPATAFSFDGLFGLAVRNLETKTLSPKP